MWKKKLLILFCAFCLPSFAQEKSVAERLGYSKTDRLLIINSDDAGMCHAANVAIIEGMDKGLVTSATIMPTCPWFNEIAAYAKKQTRADHGFGVHLTMTSEWNNYRWGPVANQSEIKGLVDSEGYLWRSVEEVYAHATPEEALREGRAQIEKALNAGVPVTHIDSHMGTMQYSKPYMEAYLQLASEFDLPARMPSQETAARMGFPDVRKAFEDKGIVMTDYFIFEEFTSDYNKDPKAVKAFWLNFINNLKPGITELYIHATIPGDEAKAITSTYPIRAAEAVCFTSDQDIRKLIEDKGIILINYRPLMELQRKSRPNK